MCHALRHWLLPPCHIFVVGGAGVFDILFELSRPLVAFGRERLVFGSADQLKQLRACSATDAPGFLLLVVGGADDASFLGGDLHSSTASALRIPTACLITARPAVTFLAFGLRGHFIPCAAAVAATATAALVPIGAGTCGAQTAALLAVGGGIDSGGAC